MKQLSMNRAQESETYQFKKKLMEAGAKSEQAESITKAFWYYYLSPGNPCMEECSDYMKTWLAKTHPELMYAYITAEPELNKFF